MSDALLVLGGVAFGVDDAAMQDMRRTRAWRWASAEALGTAPRRSYLGPGDAQMTLSGVVYPGQLGDADAVERLSALGDAGTPHTLSDSSGRALGRWVVMDINEGISAFWPGGTPRKIEWTMTLGLYTDDTEAPRG